MAYSEFLADRIRFELKRKSVAFEEKKMMGGLCFMVNNKMCVGIIKDELMARIDPGVYKNVLLRDGCKEMNFTGRPMKGFVFVEPLGIDSDKDLEYWIQLCLEHNPMARSGKN